jgi:DNA helicase HerA-like ATPase
VRVGPAAKIGSDGIWLGQLGELVPGKTPQVWLSFAKEQVVAVVGKRGSGKSFTLGVVAEGLSLASETPAIATHSTRRAILLFDPLDVYWTTRFSVAPAENREANRHYELANALKLTSASFNVEAWVPGTSNRRGTDPPWFQSLQLPVPRLGLEEWALLLDVNVLTEPMGQALADAISLVGRSGYTLRGTRIPASGSYDLNHLTDALASDEITNVYHVETVRALRQRLGALENTGLFSATGTAISALLSPSRLTVILLARLPQEYRGAVVAVLTRMLVDDRSRAAFAEKRLALDPTLTDGERHTLRADVNAGVPRTVVALDEAQTFLSPGQASVARDVFVRLVKEGRNIGLSTVVATQQPSALDTRVLSQVETFIAHQLVTEPDIQAVKENLKATMPETAEFGKLEIRPSDLLRMLEPGQCLVSASEMNTSVRRSFVVNVRPRATIHGGIEL